jgi:hypothetical protein
MKQKKQNMSNDTETQKHLLVPINIEALAVGDRRDRWTDLSPDFSKLYEGRILGSQIAPALFDHKTDIHPTGVHLHWALPDALTHGRQVREVSEDEPKQPPEFPLIPNRWMVQRIIREPESEKINLRAWIIESDFLFDADDTPPENTITVPKLEALPLFAYAGKCFDAADWQEGSNTAFKLELTALGYGDPAFAAYYPACRSMLGFHDALSDVADRTELTYMVLGWYSDPVKDPLYNGGRPASTSQWLATIEELKWSVAPSTPVYPDRTLCHGLIYKIQWENHRAVYESSLPFLDDKNCKIAVGNTSAEALAALLAKELDSCGAEDLMNAFQGDILSKNNAPEELNALLHQNRFGSFPGGHTFSVQKKTGSEDPSTEISEVVVPEDIARQAARINELENNCAGRKRKLDSYRWELYATWYKQALAYTKGEAPDQFAGQINALTARIAQEDKRLKEDLNQLKKLRQAVEHSLREQSTELESVTSLAPPFRQANDPVLLVAAEGIAPSPRHGHDGRYSEEGELHCRINGQEMTAIFVDIPNGRSGIRVRAKDIFDIPRTLCKHGVGASIKTMDSLVEECLLLNPANVDRIAGQAYIEEGLTSSPGLAELKESIASLQRPGEPAPDKAPGRVDGCLPSPVTICDWTKNPWLPLFLQWCLAWQPSYTDLKDPLANWSFTDDDYQWNGSSPKMGNEAEYKAEYEGCTILTPHAVRKFKEALQAHNRERKDSDLDPIITRLGELNMLSQFLGGLTDAFMMRDTVLQMPPIKLLQDAEILDPIAFLIEDANYASPDPDKPFLPIRAGHAKLISLSIVDAFGQTLDIPAESRDNPVRASSLLTQGEENKSFIQFPPRIAQPLRLNFDWLPAQNPQGIYPVNSPICGWMTPNHLDKNLLFFDGYGTPLGALQKILRVSASGGGGGRPEKDLKAFFWVPWPGTALKPKEILNPELRNFVAYIEAMDADTGNAFWNLLDKALAKMDSGAPEDDPLLSVLVGRPLALVLASLQLELAGLPACNQAMGQTGKFDTGGFNQVKFPLLLGDAQNDNDGLVGFFLDAASSGRTRPFYPAAGARDRTHEGLIEYDHPLGLDCETPLMLTLLMDPQAKVHARTGILPKTYGQLPNRLRSAVKTVKSVFFQAAPIISQSGDLRMPKPSDDFGQWSWACRPQVTSWEEYDKIEPAGDRAGFSPVPQEIFEGWLKLKLNPMAILNFWVQEGVAAVSVNTNITLAWTLQGGTRLSLWSTEKDKDRVKHWERLPPFGKHFCTKVVVETTYTLVLTDEEDRRTEKKLTVILREGGNE